MLCQCNSFFLTFQHWGTKGRKITQIISATSCHSRSACHRSSDGGHSSNILLKFPYILCTIHTWRQRCVHCIISSLSSKQVLQPFMMRKYFCHHVWTVTLVTMQPISGDIIKSPRCCQLVWKKCTYVVVKCERSLTPHLYTPCNLHLDR